MRIISNFHDYYDQFNDKESYHIYNRTLKEVWNTHKKYIKVPDVTYNDAHTSKRKSLPNIIRFSYMFKNVTHDKDYFYGIEACDLYIAGKYYPSIVAGNEYFYTTKSFTDRYPIHKFMLRFSAKIKDIEDHFDAFFNTTVNQAQIDSVLRQYESPIVHVSRVNGSANIRVVINQRLKNIEFNKFMDPFLAYQMISQYVENVMVSDKNPPVKISDTDKIQQHGFDKKRSFRNMPRE